MAPDLPVRPTMATACGSGQSGLGAGTSGQAIRSDGDCVAVLLRTDDERHWTVPEIPRGLCYRPAVGPLRWGPERPRTTRGYSEKSLPRS